MRDICLAVVACTALMCGTVAYLAPPRTPQPDWLLRPYTWQCPEHGHHTVWMAEPPRRMPSCPVGNVTVTSAGNINP